MLNAVCIFRECFYCAENNSEKNTPITIIHRELVLFDKNISAREKKTHTHAYME